MNCIHIINTLSQFYLKALTQKTLIQSHAKFDYGIILSQFYYILNMTQMQKS